MKSERLSAAVCWEQLQKMMTRLMWRDVCRHMFYWARPMRHSLQMHSRATANNEWFQSILSSLVIMFAITHWWPAAEVTYCFLLLVFMSGCKGPVKKGDTCFTAFANGFKFQLQPQREKAAHLFSDDTLPDILLKSAGEFYSLVCLNLKGQVPRLLCYDKACHQACTLLS